MSQQHFARTYAGNLAVNYERFFVPSIGAPLAKELVDTAAVHRGERVLDVACGTGVVARLAAARVGSTGSVAGLDLNPGMLAVAGSVTPRGAAIAWHEASAEAMPLPDDAFDVVLCQMGLQFVPDKNAAAREMRRVLKPGGRLAINLPGRTPPLFEAVDQALERHVGSEAAGFVRTVFSLHDPEEIRRLLNSAGFNDVHVQTGYKTLHLPLPEDFLWQYVHSTPLAPLMAKVDEETRNNLERDLVPKLKGFVEDGTMIYQHNPIVATARK
jgi:ubiquinone/menaquinone biosynthesis C-methylase UbiE